MAAVAAIVACANAVVVPLYGFFYGEPSPAVYAAVSLATLVVIALGSVEVLAKLSLGEAELARLLAGREVRRGTGRDEERRLVNVVDEMAIASGLPAPPLFVLTREPGINAFTAGHSPGSAVVVVTRGALERLSRDELQAVVAHEFSHILNGDVRLNLRAACALQGIVFLAGIGRFMMRYYSGFGTEEGRRFLHLPLALAGAGLFAVGAVGLVFARLIQSAISREREFLADACAVQYTRNADALCGALARIESDAAGSRLLDRHADGFAHMLFAANARAWLGALFATHPPLAERMRRANPHQPPGFYRERLKRAVFVEKPRQVQAREKSPPRPETIVPKRLTNVAALVATIGAPGPEHLEVAAGLLAYLPASVREALADPAGAQAAMLGCLIDEEATARTRQLRALEALGQAALARRAENLAPLLRQLGRPYRLALIALALPALTGLDEAGRGAFLAALRAAIEADARLTLGEFVLETILDWNLGPKAKRAGGVRYRDCGEVAAEIALVLSLLAHAGGAAEASFARGSASLGMDALALAARDSLALGRVTEALERLSLLAPLEKEKLLGACAATAAADADVRLSEHELLRAVASALDCPMPPAAAALDPRLLRA